MSPRYLPTHFSRLVSLPSHMPADWRTKLTVTKLPNSYWDPLIEYVPENSLVGLDDNVPGLEGSCVEIPQDPETEIVHSFNDRQNLYIHLLTLKCNLGWETHLINYVKCFANAKYGDSLAKQSGSVVIIDRLLRIDVHNSWKILEEYVFNFRKQKDDSVLSSEQRMTIEKVPLNEDIALVFYVEYRFKITLVSKATEQINLRIGFTTVHPKLAVGKFSSTKIHNELKIGP